MTNSNISPINHINPVRSLNSLIKNDRHLAVENKNPADDQQKKSSDHQNQPSNPNEPESGTDSIAPQNIFNSDSDHIDFRA